ncbi:hypothetical protein MY11210_000400 [Beauveria gryllotalpidicola]
MPGRSTTPIDSCNTSSKKSGRIATDIPTLPFADAQAFRRYIINVGVAAPGVWLKIAKKSTMIPTVTYDAAIDEALCCRLDRRPAAPARTRGTFLQRFTPRRRRFHVVAAQRRQGRRLGCRRPDAAGRPRRGGRGQGGRALGKGGTRGPRPSRCRPIFAALLDARPRAATMFDELSKAARYPFLHRLQTVKKEETRTRKMAEFVELLDRGDTL